MMMITRSRKRKAVEDETTREILQLFVRSPGGKTSVRRVNVSATIQELLEREILSLPCPCSASSSCSARPAPSPWALGSPKAQWTRLISESSNVTRVLTLLKSGRELRLQDTVGATCSHNCTLELSIRWGPWPQYAGRKCNTDGCNFYGTAAQDHLCSRCSAQGGAPSSWSAGLGDCVRTVIQQLNQLLVDKPPRELGTACCNLLQLNKAWAMSVADSGPHVLSFPREYTLSAAQSARLMRVGELGVYPLPPTEAYTAQLKAHGVFRLERVGLRGSVASQAKAVVKNYDRLKELLLMRQSTPSTQAPWPLGIAASREGSATVVEEAALSHGRDDTDIIPFPVLEKLTLNRCSSSGTLHMLGGLRAVHGGFPALRELHLYGQTLWPDLLSTIGESLVERLELRAPEWCTGMAQPGNCSLGDLAGSSLKELTLRYWEKADLRGLERCTSLQTVTLFGCGCLRHGLRHLVSHPSLSLLLHEQNDVSITLGLLKLNRALRSESEEARRSPPIKIMPPMVVPDAGSDDDDDADDEDEDDDDDDDDDNDGDDGDDGDGDLGGDEDE